MNVKVLDSKGRVALGARFARQTVIIDDSNSDRIIITPAVVIPAAEAWILGNPAALDLLSRGLKDAREGRLVDGPDLEGDGLVADEA